MGRAYGRTSPEEPKRSEDAFRNACRLGAEAKAYLVQLIAANEWKNVQPASGSECDAIIDKAAASMGKGRADFEQLLTLPAAK